ncbi:DEAD/DEAH box helicase [Desulforamulus ruminis]|uniref:DEAD/DEAH box helicase n=1 Tax=Desulforamulus ruminis TaxID=1564 RepID=UPI001EE423F6|nr:DEAD/DEAH box helicase [Desulforamulus ruminis]
MWSLAVKDREQIKSKILAELPEDEPVKLVDLLLKLRINPQNLIAGLQSLVANRLLKVARVKKTGAPMDEVWIARNEVAESELTEAGEGDWLYNPQLLAVKQRQLASLLGDDSKGKIIGLLEDGRPRTLAEMKLQLGSEELPPLGGIAQILELPDGRVTLCTTAVGKAELERRQQEQQLLREKLKDQESKLKDLFRDGKSASREELEAALQGPVLPGVKYPVVRLVNGRYAQADSPAAWEDMADYVAARGPLSMEEIVRKFKIHSSLVADLRGGKEKEPFIRLPNGTITTSGTPEGRAELTRRQVGLGLKERLEDFYRRQPFFNLGQILDSPEQRETAIQMIRSDGCYRINVQGVGLWTSPYPHSPRIIAQELKRLTGLHLEAGEGPDMVPLTMIASRSMTVAEAADKLKLREEDILNLCELEELSSFRLDGNRRLWKDEVRDIKYRSDLHKLVKGASKLTTLEAADLLETTPEQVRRLVREGYIKSAGEAKSESGRSGILVRRGDIQSIKERLPGIEHEWSLATRQPKRETASKVTRREKAPVGKKRPRRAAAPPALTGPVELDDFQKQAIQAALVGRNVLVAAPTGTGKTVIAERLIEAVIERGKAAVYTSPLKALSNQKFVDFRQVFGEDMVGLVTGDISINPYAPLLIMTTEIFRNRCFSEPEGLDDIACVVFDEIHYLDDPERGTAWEESIIFAPPHIKFLGLSATVPNIQEIADWMGEVRGEPVEVVVETNRAVPLAINWITSDGAVLDEDEAREYVEEAVRKRAQEKKAERQAAREEEFEQRSRRWSKRGARRSRKPVRSH